MFSIVCFVGLFLVAIGASAAEAEDTHLQTLSVHGRLYTLPSTTQILLDEQSTTPANLLGLEPGLQASGHSGPRISPRGDVLEPPGCTRPTSVAASMPLQMVGRRFTLTDDAIIEGFENMDAGVIGDTMINAGLDDADANPHVPW